MMGMGQEMLEEAALESAVEDAEQIQYEARIQATAAKRLAYILHDLKIIGDYALAEFLFPSEEAIEQVEGEAMP